MQAHSIEKQESRDSKTNNQVAGVFSQCSAQALQPIKPSIITQPQFVERSMIPFSVIRAVYQNNATNLMGAATESLARYGLATSHKKDEFITSCVINAYTVAVIFMGEELAGKIYISMNKSISVSLAFDLQSGKKWWYGVYNLFGGPVLKRMQNHNAFLDNEERFKNLIEYMKPSIDDFFASNKRLLKSKSNKNNTVAVTDEKEIACYRTFFSSLEYDFNVSTFYSLKNDMMSNEKSIKENVTYIYFVTILEPIEGSIDESSYNHAFVLEQFLHKEQVYYRIYQSWIHKATLLDDFKKRKYDALGNGAWNACGMLNFLDRLEALYCRDKQAKRDPSLLMEQCFGYRDTITPLTVFEGDKLAGISMRYFAQRVDPADAANNLEVFLKKYSKLTMPVTRGHIDSQCPLRLFAQGCKSIPMVVPTKRHTGPLFTSGK